MWIRHGMKTGPQSRTTVSWLRGGWLAALWLAAVAVPLPAAEEEQTVSRSATAGVMVRDPALSQADRQVTAERRLDDRSLAAPAAEVQLTPAPEVVEKIQSRDMSLRVMPAEGELVRALSPPMARQDILTALDARDTSLHALDNSAAGERVRQVLADPRNQTVEFATIDVESLQIADMSDGRLEDNYTFGAMRLARPELHRSRADTLQLTAGLEGDAGAADGDAALVVNDSGVSGLIRRGDALYEVTPIGDGIHALSLKTPLEPSAEQAVNDVYFDEDEALNPDLMDGAGGSTAMAMLSAEEIVARCGPDADFGADGEPVEISLVAGYTPAARRAALDQGGKDLENLVLMAASVGDTTFRNSNIPVRLRVTGMVEVDYQETASNFLRERRDMISGAPGLEPLRQLRLARRADVMILVINRDDHQRCGLAGGLGVRQPENAVAVANWRCMNELFTYVHEIGHLVGAWHNPEVLSGRPPADTPFALGFVQREGRAFSTIMAYPTTCSPDPCPRIWQWSNPDVQTFFGAPAGTQGHNNACVWRIRASEVAAFGDQLTTVAGDASDLAADNDGADGQTEDTAAGDAAEDGTVANLGTAPERVFLHFDQLSLIFSTDNPAPRVTAAGQLLAGADQFELRALKPFLFHLRHRRWQNFYWKINSSRKGAWRVTGGRFGELGGEAEALSLTVNVRGDADDPAAVMLVADDAYLVYRPGGGLQIASQRNVLSYGPDWQIRRVRPYLHHLRRADWDGFWKVNSSRQGIWEVGGGQFGSLGGSERELPVRVRAVDGSG